MRVLIIGQGGREHAMCWKLQQSPLVKEIFVAPGNAGTSTLADRVPIDSSDVIELADFALKLQMDLTIVGPELPLTLGIVDEFHKRELPIFGPTRLAAELEGSKVFSKEFMRKYAIPTAEAAICNSLDEANHVLSRGKFPKVLKVDGLASGKGVMIIESKAGAAKDLKAIFVDRKYGRAADRVLIEDFLVGEEVSFMAISDGRRVIPFAPAKDYKRAYDGDTGPNTGGMGSHSPAVVLSADISADIMRSIVIPTIQGMETEGRPYTGCLYVGLILTAEGPKVLEYNCRFGDPETQAQMLRLEDDLAEVLLKVARGNLSDTRLTWKKEAAACVVVAAPEYPGGTSHGVEIRIDTPSDPSVVVFHSGTDTKDGSVVTAGGRIASVCAHAPTLTEALDKAYAAAPGVQFEGAWYRKDIGYRVLEERK